jgi:ABC-type uncharacterized transport system permease subunit
MIKSILNPIREAVEIYYRHSCECGRPLKSIDWIPTFAGMMQFFGASVNILGGGDFTSWGFVLIPLTLPSPMEAVVKMGFVPSPAGRRLG